MMYIDVKRIFATNDCALFGAKRWDYLNGRRKITNQ